jgi:L-alanine-DL-glutamate epimerase-like enolase superfamily enzyme
MALDVDCRLVDLEMRHRWAISRASLTRKQVAVVRLRWNGLDGWGEAAPISRYGENVTDVPEAVRRLAPALGDDPRAYRTVSAALAAAAPGHFAAKAALDMAVHDLAAKALGVPLGRVLGVDASAARMPETSFSIGIDTPEVVADKTREAAPYSILKVKVGTPDDRAIIGAVRSVTTKPIRVDANEAWKDPAAALATIEWLAAQGVELVEQPLPAADQDGARWLRARSPLPIVADEAVQSPADLARVADGYHGVNVKLMKHGGVAPTLDVIAVARALGLKVMIGCMIETGLGIAAAAHIAPLCDWVDLDGNVLLVADPFPGHPIVDGRLALRDAPGLGVAPASAWS